MLLLGLDFYFVYVLFRIDFKFTKEFQNDHREFLFSFKSSSTNINILHNDNKMIKIKIKVIKYY